MDVLLKDTADFHKRLSVLVELAESSLTEESLTTTNDNHTPLERTIVPLFTYIEADHNTLNKLGIIVINDGYARAIEQFGRCRQFTITPLWKQVDVNTIPIEVQTLIQFIFENRLK